MSIQDDVYNIILNTVLDELIPYPELVNFIIEFAFDDEDYTYSK